jgi:ABC-type glycerol-3-phosphate transport system substrate-binding protein
MESMQPKCTVGRLIFSALCGVGSAVAILAGFAGCSEAPPPPPPSKPFPGVTIHVSPSNVPAVRELVERHGRDWADRTGARVETAAAGAPADIRLFATADLGRLVTTGELSPLSLTPLKGSDAFEYAHLLQHETERNMDWGGKTYAVPLLGEAIVCVYRADLLDDPKHKAALDNQFKELFHHPMRTNGPATWQEVAVIAEYFASQTGWTGQASVPGRSLPPLPSAAKELERDFHLIAAPIVRRAVNMEKSATLSNTEKTRLTFSYQFDAETGEPLIDRPGFVAALQLMQRLQACRAPGVSERPIDAFQSGKAVFAIATLADISRLQQADSLVRDKFAVCRIPGSDSVYDGTAGKVIPFPGSEGNAVPFHGHGGWMAGLAADSSQVAAATDLLLYLSSPRVSQEIVCETAWGGGPTRAGHLDSRVAWHNYGLSANRTLQLVAALDSYYRATLRNSAHALRIPDHEEHERAFARRVTQALQQNQPADAALKDVAQAWRDLAKGQDKSASLRDYRMSQGLR